MVHGAPVPALPAVGVVVHARHADRVGEAEQRGEVVADVAPGVVRAVAHRDRARAVVALLPLDLVGDDVERLVPRDAHIARLAAVLRIALAVGIEVDALHGMQQAVRRVDHRLVVLAVRGERRAARRRQVDATGADRPRRAVRLGQIDRRNTHDPAGLGIDVDRPAVRHVAGSERAVRHRRAPRQADRLHHHHGLGEPVRQVLRPLDRQLEVLLRVDLGQPVDRRRQQLGGDRSILEAERHVGLAVPAGARGDAAVLEPEPARGPLVPRDQHRRHVALTQAGLERRIAPGGEPQELRHPPQDGREFGGSDRHLASGFRHSCTSIQVAGR